jgi:hypothetical protein
MRSRDVILDELTGLIVRLRKKKTEVEAQLSLVDAQISAVEITLNLLRTDKMPDLSQTYDSLVSEISGKTLLEALVAVARKSNNRLRVREAKRLLLEAGLLGNSKNALSVLYTTISRSNRFEKVKPGEYKIKGEDDTPRR